MPRTTRTPANPHRTGHYAGLHPEDEPYMSNQRYVPDDEEYEDDDTWPTRQPTSAIRYTTAPAQARRAGGRLGAISYDQEPPPIRRKSRQQMIAAPAPQAARRRMHWIFWLGLAFLVMLASYMAIQALGSFWQAKEDDWTYGNPRIFQIDAVVGHNDSASNPSHFIAQNLNGNIVVVEMPGGDTRHARSYPVMTLPGNDSYPPVRLIFKDMNGDGKPDMVIQVGDQGSTIEAILYNDGKQFVGK